MNKIIGKINFTKGHVTVTDPCYDEGTWCSAKVENVFSGDWEVFVEIKNCGNWGNRVASLEVKAVGQTAVKTEKRPEDIGVDAGVCGIFEDKPNYGDGAWSDVCDEMDMLNYGIAKKDNAFKCVGAWSSSGYGDGGYDAYVSYNEAGEVVGIKVVYLNESPEEEFEMEM